MQAWLTLLSLGAVSRLGAASPLPKPPVLASRSIGDFSCFNASLPNITIYATGGTIAGSASSSDQTTGYQAGALGVQTLIDAVPDICEVSNVRGVQIANVDSGSINSTILLTLAHAIQEDLDGSDTQGVIVTHGTDSMEESAFFFDLTINSEKPVVVVGAMRPATAISADGPMNLLAATKLAVSDKAKGRGTMIVLNDRIASARYTVKTNANSLDTFKAEEQGFLGVFENVEPVFWYPPSRPYGHYYFNVSSSDATKALPQVDVLYGHQEADPKLFQSAIDDGAVGIVLAGMGAGGWPSKAVDVLEEVLNETDIPVVVSRRTAWGYVEGERDFGIGAGYLNPSKARIQLQLALEKGLSNEQIKDIFEYV